MEMMHAEDVLMFSSDYPHWDNEFPEYTLNGLSAELKDRICFQNALEVFPGLTLPVTTPA
jgi:predicted TIM-barrel fold metal-dependent hydrolase